MVDLSPPHLRWACSYCSYAYEPKLGDPEHGYPAGTLFEELDEDWCCPWCGAPKDTFVREDQLDA